MSLKQPRAKGNHLREWRLVAGFTQAETEEALGLPQSRISHLENGNALVTREVLEQLAPFYACEPADLMKKPPRDRVRAALGYQKPQRRQSKPASATVARLPEGLAMLQQLASELRKIKGEHAARLTAFENQLNAAGNSIASAIHSASEMTERWERDLAVLRDAISSPATPRSEVAMESEPEISDDPLAGGAKPAIRQ